MREPDVDRGGLTARVFIVAPGEDVESISAGIHLARAINCLGECVGGLDVSRSRIGAHGGTAARGHASSGDSCVESRGTRKKPSRTLGAKASSERASGNGGPLSSRTG